MFDYACIFTTGGVVLWCKTFYDSNLKFELINHLIKDVLLDDKNQNKTSQAYQDSVLRWKVHPDVKIVFAIVYKEILQLTMIDEFLEMLKFDFEQKVWPKLRISAGVVQTLPSNYDQRFEQIMQAWEQKKHSQTEMTKSGQNTTTNIHKMRTFDQSVKSKKTLKREAKRLAQDQ